MSQLRSRAPVKPERSFDVKDPFRPKHAVSLLNASISRCGRFAWTFILACALTPNATAQKSTTSDLESLKSELKARITEVKFAWTAESQQKLIDVCFKAYDAFWYQWQDEGKRYGFTDTRKDFQRYVNAYWKTHKILPRNRQCGFWFADQISSGRQHSRDYALTDFNAHHIANKDDKHSARMLYLLWATGLGGVQPEPVEAAGWLRAATKRAEELNPQRQNHAASKPASRPPIDPIEANLQRWLERRRSNLHLSSLHSEIRNTLKSGKHYVELKPAQAVYTKPSEVEVRLFTSYVGCKPCVDLHLALEARLPHWNEQKPSFIVLNRVFVQRWDGGAKEHARLFYSLAALGRSDLYAHVTKAIAADGRAFIGADAAMALSMQQTFVQSHGVDPESYKKIAQSFSTEARLRGSKEESLKLKLEVLDMPAVLVSGKYLIHARNVGGASGMLLLAEALADASKPPE
jgi:hypothetical protein